MTTKRYGINRGVGVSFRMFQIEKIKALAEKRGLSFSQTVREIIDDYKFDELAEGSLSSAGITKK